MLVSVQGVCKAFLDDVVLENVNFDIKENHRLGLLGANGAGKTTLLNIIKGDILPDQGQVIRARGMEIGYLKQNDALASGNSLEEEIKDAFAEVFAIEAKMKECAKALEKKPKDKALLNEYDKLQARFEAKDGYHVQERANRVLNGLGFGNFSRNTAVGTLSGGEKMRFGFAKMLLRQPDLLMLDEPTNHLDFNMLAWLEEYLAAYRGAVLVVSHDRYFLDAVAQDICEVEHHALALYHGGYTSFTSQKAQRQLVEMRAFDKQQEEIAKMEDYVRRNMARASTSNMAKSRQKTLDKMERLERPQGEGRAILLNFSYDVEPFETVLEVKNLSVSAGKNRKLCTGVGLCVKRGEKIAIVGENGVGKSSFLKAIQNILPRVGGGLLPEESGVNSRDTGLTFSGSARFGGNVRIGYFDQELAGLPMDKTVLEAVHSCYKSKTEFEIRTLLGRLLLGGDTVYKKVGELSGAMRAKVAFAILQMRRANLLILDEPTNHLDYRAKEVLESALQNFEGTIIVVSHDRYFLRQVPTAVLEMTADGFIGTKGNYDAYLKEKKERQAVVVQKAEKPVQGQNANPGKRTKEERAKDAQKRGRIAFIEKEIAELEERIETQNAALQAPQNLANYSLLAQISGSLKEDTAALDAAMEEWLMLSQE